MENVPKLDPRVKRTRLLLQNALMSLAREKPMESITVQEIAARAEVNRATFYAHFEDKNALLNYMVREMFQARLGAKLPDQPHMSPENLRLLIWVTCEYISEFLSHCAPVRQANEQAMMFVPVQDYLYEILSEWLQRAGVSAPEVVPVSLSWTIWGTAFQWAREGRKVPLDGYVPQILVLVQGALQSYSPKGAGA